MQTPVLFIIFNRPETTFKVFEQIRKIKPEKLFIAADGPRDDHPDDKEKTRLARSVVEKVDWECEVQTLLREKNIGCGIGVSEAINWFFKNNEEGIILEDDCVPDLTFFEFCSEMLERYRNNEKIISINGSNLGSQFEGHESYFFSRFMNMWGWATWQDRAIKIDYRLTSWYSSGRSLWKVYKMLRQSVFDGDINWYKYWKEKFDLTVKREAISWWDWQWIFYQRKNNLLSVVPSKNLVTNIGFHNDATHTLAKDNPSANIPYERISFPLVHPKGIKPDFNYEEKAVKYTWCYHRRMPLKNYVLNRIKAKLGIYK